MDNTSSNTTSGSAGNKTLWIIIGALGAAVIALGATLIYNMKAPTAPTQASTAPAAGAPLPPAAAPAAPTDREPPTKASRHAVGSAAAPHAAPRVASPSTSDQPMPREICSQCATVTAVTPVEREGQASGAGAVAGGVLGALVGNQFGGGTGKDLATIAGAVGGGMAGNAVEKKMKKVTAYQIQLRMDDGSIRTLEQGAPVSVGTRVRVDGYTLQPL